MTDAEKYGYSPFDDELQMQDKREVWKDREIERLLHRERELTNLLCRWLGEYGHRELRDLTRVALEADDE